MGKKHKTGETQASLVIKAPAEDTFTCNGVTVEARTIGRWGFGFEHFGTKWKAYRTGVQVEYLSPERGEELHSAVAKIQAAMALEVNRAIRSRGKA